jgi:hypothetical protein
MIFHDDVETRLAVVVRRPRGAASAVRKTVAPCAGRRGRRSPDWVRKVLAESGPSDLPLLFAAVRTASLNLIKSEQRQTNREQNALNGGPTVWWDADTLAEREWTEAVAQAIASLPLDQREALVLRICPTRWNASDRARIEPGSSIRLQIAADLATQSHDSLQDASRCTRAAVGEQLMWATGGAIAASLAFLLAGTAPVGREQPVAAAMHVISLVAPGEASPPRVREEAIG